VALFYADASTLVNSLATRRGPMRAAHSCRVPTLSAVSAWPRPTTSSRRALLPIERGLTAGALAEPMLRALDAIHIASAVAVLPIDAFVTYDDRQGAAARLAGLRTVAPG
jgi:predicted nucleic acid-binding protein